MTKSKFSAMLLCATLMALPALAQDYSTVNSFLDGLINFLTGTFARSIGIIGLIFAGALMMTGRIEARTFFIILGGLVIMFGAPTIVDGFAN